MDAVTPARLDGLRADLAGIALADDAATLKLKSRDFFWFSPILKPMLDGKRADLVVMPRSQDEVMRVAAACARHRVPLTVRGGGTGNYGQAVPLEGGVLLDMSGLDRAVERDAGRRPLRGGRPAPRNRPDAARPVRSRRPLGTPLPSLDAQAGDHRRLHRRRRGGLRLLHLGADRRSGRGARARRWSRSRRRRGVIELTGRDILKVLHAYGVNGIITEVDGAAGALAAVGGADRRLPDAWRRRPASDGR